MGQKPLSTIVLSSPLCPPVCLSVFSSGEMEFLFLCAFAIVSLGRSSDTEIHGRCRRRLTSGRRGSWRRVISAIGGIFFTFATPLLIACAPAATPSSLPQWPLLTFVFALRPSGQSNGGQTDFSVMCMSWFVVEFVGEKREASGRGGEPQGDGEKEEGRAPVEWLRAGENMPPC